MRATAWLLVICGAYLVLAGWYASTIPFGQAPDESAHLPYVEHLYEKRALPVFSAQGGSYEFHQPPLYYALAVPAYALAGANHAASFLAVRWVTIVLGIGMILITYALALQTFPQRQSLALGAASLTAFLPMHVALCASITNDILAEILFGGVLLCCAAWLRSGWTAHRAAFAGALTGLGLLAKSATAPLFAIGWLAIFLGHARNGKVSCKPLIVHVLAFTAAAMAVAGWWLARNQALYGDALAMRAFMETFKGRPTPEYFFQRGLSFTGYLALVGMWTFESFWGVFGNMNVFMPARSVYVPLAILCIIGAGGVVRFLFSWKSLEEWQRRILILVGFAIVMEVAVFVRFNMSFFQAQARYLFPVLPVWAMLLCLGLGQWAGTRRAAVELVPGMVALALAIAALPLWIRPVLVG